MKLNKGIFLACAILLSGTAASASAQAVSVTELAARWTSAYNRGSPDAIAALYSDRAELYVHGDQRVVGRSDIRAYWADDMRVSKPLTVLTVTDSVVDQEMILVHGNYQVLDRNTGVPQGQGRFAHIWIKGANGEWRLDRDLWHQPAAAAR